MACKTARHAYLIHPGRARWRISPTIGLPSMLNCARPCRLPCRRRCQRRPRLDRSRAVAEHGGWTNDAQFIDQMGSPYLLAIGLGTPVADAVTTRLQFPQPGTLSAVGPHPRLGAGASPRPVPGRRSAGRPSIASSAAAASAAGRGKTAACRSWPAKCELRLHDLTGYYGRCDAVVLAADLQWTPPGDTAAIAALREQHGGVSRDVQDAGAYDVVVVGGGLAGCMAAVAAARLGVRRRWSRTGPCWAATPAWRSSCRRSASGRTQSRIRSIRARRA